MNGFSPRARTDALRSIASNDLDLLVVGGGIVGSGIARDAAMRGMRAALVDQYDFAYGTSSRSSRLLHGGLRYLAQGRVGLVREASLEKRILHRIAPHLADPLPFIFPSYRGTPWPLWQLRIGVKIYDFLCSGRNLGASRSMNARDTLTALPQLLPDRLAGAACYYDGLTNDARLVMDTVRSAARHGAMACNYTKFLDASRVANLWECKLSDQLTGESLSVRARAIVNATGPWAEDVPHSHVRLRLTKGIHLVIDRHKLSVPGAVVMTEGKRILFVIPWGTRVILGTTDTDYDDRIEDVRVAPEDTAYVLAITNKFFPAAKLTGADIISSWAGLRPLIAKPNGKPSDISRSHQILHPESGWWDVAGGKLTTYRLMAEQTVDRVSDELNFRGTPCRTADELLLPPGESASYSGIVPPPFGRDAVEHFCRREWAVHLDDVMFRRSSWQHYHADSDAKAEQVAAWMAHLLEWSPEQTANELARHRREAGNIRHSSDAVTN